MWGDVLHTMQQTTSQGNAGTANYTLPAYMRGHEIGLYTVYIYMGGHVLGLYLPAYMRGHVIIYTVYIYMGGMY